MSILRCLCLLSALLAVGCTTSHRAREFADLKLPVGEKPMDQTVWDAVDAAQPGAKLGEQKSRVFPIPFNLYTSLFNVDENRERAHRSSLTINDLLIPGIFLPVRIRYTEFVHERGTEEPIAARRATWTPFLAWTKKRGDEAIWGSDVSFSGVPLIYGNLSRTSDDERGTLNLSFTHTLWTLGPAFIKVNGASADKPEETRGGYFATPLLLTGFLGTIVWSDYHYSDNKASVVGHGPLWGLLGYWSDNQLIHRPIARTGEEEPDEEQPVEALREARRYVLGGILWHDRSLKVEESGSVLKSAHGPLWGMFGWGKRNDAFRLRFLFIPIG